jgi:hypothetical protein
MFSWQWAEPTGTCQPGGVLKAETLKNVSRKIGDEEKFWVPNTRLSDNVSSNFWTDHVKSLLSSWQFTSASLLTWH